MVELLSDSVSFFLFLAGAILLVAEAFAPGAHFFVLGVALLTAGLVGILSPVGGIAGIVLLAAAVLVATALTLWGYRKLDIYGGGGAAETSHSGSLTGQFGTVTERVTTSDGEVKLEDGGFNPYYRARSVDGVIEVGEEVIVVDPGGGNVVTVEPVSSQDDIDRALERERHRSGPASDDATNTDDTVRETDVESDRAS